MHTGREESRFWQREHLNRGTGVKKAHLIHGTLKLGWPFSVVQPWDEIAGASYPTVASHCMCADSTVKM